MSSPNSIINVRGLTRPILVLKKEAEAVRQIFEEPKYPESYIIRVNRYAFRKGDIKSVEISSDRLSSEKFDEEMRLSVEEEKRERAKVLKLSPEVRAQRLEFFRFMYRSALGPKEEPSNEKLDQARRIQSDFFKANPRRTVCDPRLFKSIIGNPGGIMLNAWQSAGFRIVEAVASRDMYLSK